ncbi:MAG: Hpt domain-containing protein [Inhella sp.]
MTDSVLPTASDDLTPLAWVHEELRRTLEGVHKGLRRTLREYDLRLASNQLDETQTRTVLGQQAAAMHQGSGALQMVGMREGALVLQANEALLRRMMDEAAINQAQVEALERADFAVLTYITRMLAAARPSPLTLFPVYRAVQELNKAGRIHPADFWPAQFQWHPLPPLVLDQAVPPVDALRTAFDTALLRYLRQPTPPHALQLADLCKALSNDLPDEPLTSFWQLASAQYEALACQLIEGDAFVKRLGSRLVAQLRSHAQGHREVSERLIQDLLFFCAQSREPEPGTAPCLEAVRRIYGLSDISAGDYRDESLGRVDPSWVAQALRRLHTAKEAWSASSEGDVPRAAGMEEAFAALGESLTQLFPNGEFLGQTLQRAALVTARAGHRPPAALAMEMASAMLYLEAALEDAVFDQPEQGPRVARLAERVQQAATGQPSEALEPWMEDVFRRVSDRQTMSGVVQELRHSMQEVERLVDEYFRDPAARRAQLVQVPGPLTAMRGVLSVLGLPQAAIACVRMRDDVDRLAETEVDPTLPGPQIIFDRLASNLGQLGFLIDMLNVQPHLVKSMFRFDEERGELVAEVAPSRRKAPATEAPLVEQVRAAVQAAPADPAQAARDLERLALQAAADDQPALALVTHGAALELEPQGRDLSALELPDLELPELPVVTPPNEPAGAQALSGTEALTAYLDSQPATLPEPTPAPASAPLPSTDEEIDEEMLEIFLEEAGEVVGQARDALALLQQDPADRAQITNVRRSFHTLKGSSRMVGLNVFGEAAWSVEQLFNKLLSDDAALSVEVRQFTSDALDELSDWRSDIAAGTAGQRTPEGLRQRADALRLGQPWPQPVVEPVAEAVSESEAPLPDLEEPLPEVASSMETELNVELAMEVLEQEAAAAEADEAALSEQGAATSLTPEEGLLVGDSGDLLAEEADVETSPSLEPLGVDVPLTQPAALDGLEVDTLPGGDLSDESVRLAFEPDSPVAMADTEPVPLDEPVVLEVALDGLETAESLAVGEVTIDLGEPTEPAPLAAPETLPDLDLAVALAAPADATPSSDVAEAQPDEEWVLPLEAPPAAEPLEAAAEGEPIAAQEPEAEVHPGQDPEMVLDVAPEILAEPASEAAPEPAVEPLPDTLPSPLESEGDFVLTFGDSIIPSDDVLAITSPPEPEPVVPLEALVEAVEAAHVAPVTDGLEVGSEAAPALDSTDGEERLRRIGDLRLSETLYGIFIGEADELARRLTVGLHDWAQVHDEAPPTSAEVQAHALAGNSATVGFEVLSVLARALEHALGRAQQAQAWSAESAALFTRSADAIAQLLHQFAAGFLETPDPGLVPALQAYQPEVLPEGIDADRLPVESPPDTSPAPAVSLLDDDDFVPGEPDQIDDELWEIFEEEASDLLHQLQGRLRDWTAHPQDVARGDACMRTLHTFKGGARLAGAMRLGDLAHRLETDVAALMAADHRSAGDLVPLQHRGDDIDAEFERLRQQLREGIKPGAAPVAAPEVDVQPEPTPMVPISPLVVEPLVPPVQEPALLPEAVDWSRFLGHDAREIAAADAAPLVGAQAMVRVRASLLDRLAAQAGEVSIRRARMESELSQMKTALLELDDNLERLRLQLRELEVQAEAQISSRQEQAKAAGSDFDPLEFDRYTRFQEVTRMLAESVNDVATVQRSLQRNLAQGEDELAAQSRLTRELQDDLLRSRMVEFDSLAERLHRVVRQAARESGKQAQLEISGGGIELDRGVLERLIGAFEHLLRNSVVHGIEPAEVRAQAGKSDMGVLRIRLAQEGNQVLIAFSDDGAGLSLQGIRAKAAHLGLLPEGREPTEAELVQMIYAPGFSTASNVSELAGRGVGMDVVRSEVNTLGGYVLTRTQAGRGTEFDLRVPLTTALTQVVVLRCGDLKVAVPASLIDPVLRLPNAQLNEAYATGTLKTGPWSVPMYWLGGLLAHDDAPQLHGKHAAVVLVHSGPDRIALHVDEVVGNQEVVVKNLGPQLMHVPGLAGISLLASGSVALIYNPVALAERFGHLALERTHAVGKPVAAEAAPIEVLAPLVMVVDDSLTVRRVSQRFLEREGYRVLLAKDGLDAMEQLAREELPDMVLSDIEMPRMDGFDLVRNIRADQRLKDLPVVMITSRIAEKHRDYAEALGVQGYLGKPYDEEQLLGLIRQHTRRTVAV